MSSVETFSRKLPEWKSAASLAAERANDGFTDLLQDHPELLSRSTDVVRNIGSAGLEAAFGTLFNPNKKGFMDFKYGKLRKGRAIRAVINPIGAAHRAIKAGVKASRNEGFSQARGIRQEAVDYGKAKAVEYGRDQFNSWQDSPTIESSSRIDPTSDTEFFGNAETQMQPGQRIDRMKGFVQDKAEAIKDHFSRAETYQSPPDLGGPFGDGEDAFGQKIESGEDLWGSGPSSYETGAPAAVDSQNGGRIRQFVDKRRTKRAEEATAKVMAAYPSKNDEHDTTF